MIAAQSSSKPSKRNQPNLPHSRKKGPLPKYFFQSQYHIHMGEGERSIFLMNINVIILNERLANSIQEHIKNIILHDHFRFILEILEWLTHINQ